MCRKNEQEDGGGEREGVALGFLRGVSACCVYVQGVMCVCMGDHSPSPVAEIL